MQTLDEVWKLWYYSYNDGSKDLIIYNIVLTCIALVY